MDSKTDCDGKSVEPVKDGGAAGDRYRLLATHGRDILLFFRPDGTLVEANVAATEAYGYSREELLSKSMFDLRAPETHAEIAKDIAGVRSGPVHFETTHMRRDGKRFPVEVSWTFDRIGGEEVILSVIRDISERRAAEAKLRESEERYRALYGALPVAAFVCDRNAVIQNFNSRAVELWGREPKVGVEQHCGSVKLILPDGSLLPHAESPMMEVLLTGTACRNVEVFIERPDGSRIPVIVNFCALKDAQNEIVGVVTSFDDVTERMQAGEALRASENRKSAILNASLDAIVTMDHEGKVVDFNPAAEQTFGYRREEAVGQLLAELIIPQPLRQRHHDGLALYLATGQGPVLNQRIELPALHADGREFPVELSISPIAGQDPPMFTSTLRDITAQQEAEAELFKRNKEIREHETRMRLATEATAVGIWEWNIVTDEIRWDAQMFRIYGIPRTTDGLVEHSDWKDAVLPEDLPESQRIMGETLRDSGQSRREFRIRRRDDGEVRDIEAVETVRTNEEGQAEWVVGTNLDVTNRKKTAADLRQLAADLSDAHQRKDEFLATLAHELRNPLAPIRNGLDLMKAQGLDGSTEMVHSMMERQLLQMVRLVDDLMDVSRISRGKIDLRNERIPLSTVLNSAIETSRPLIDQMGHELFVALPEEPIILLADMTRLAQVFLNLLNNAAKYSEQGGNIWLSVEQQGSEAVVTIKDIGIGIASHQLPRIFDMFTQVDRSLEKSQSGLGIGLTLVKRLVEMHGGTVEARSEGLGKGCEFIVRLPIAIEVSESQELLTEQKQLSALSLRILIVDDNRDLAHLLSLLLETAGNEIRVAHDGQAGVELAEEFRPDVVVLDIGLPVLNGYEACRRIREQPWGKNIVLIASTGWGGDEYRRQSLAAGFDHHMVKPVDAHVLLKVLVGVQAANAEV